MTSLVTFCVGGKDFTIARFNLNRDEGNWFTSLLNGKWNEELICKDTRGVYYIDRNPKSFEYVHKYLQGYHFALPKDQELLQDIVDDAHFYSLSGMISYLEELQNPIPEKYETMDNNEILHGCKWLLFRLRTKYSHDINDDYKSLKEDSKKNDLVAAHMEIQNTYDKFVGKAKAKSTYNTIIHMTKFVNDMSIMSGYDLKLENIIEHHKDEIESALYEESLKNEDILSGSQGILLAITSGIISNAFRVWCDKNKRQNNFTWWEKITARSSSFFAGLRINWWINS